MSQFSNAKICLHLEDEDIVSAPLRVRVIPPFSREEELIAQDFFCDEVGRVLSFNGSSCLTKANDLLAETIERLPDRKVGIHADIALNMPKTRNFKQLTMSEKGYLIHEIPAEEKAIEHLAQSLGATPEKAKSAADALGNINCNHYFNTVATALENMGNRSLELEVARNICSTFEERKVIDSEISNLRNLIRKIEK